MNTLELLWQDYIVQKTQYIIPGSEYARISAEAFEILEQVWSELSKEGNDQYDTYCYKEAELNQITEQERFLEGFRLGAGIILDLLRPQSTDVP